MEERTASNIEKPASKLEIFSWAMFDFANSTYATIVMTAVYSAYFVKTVAGKTEGIGESMGTLLLTISVCISSLLIVFTAPIIGSMADATAQKKKYLFIATIVCIIFTGLLALVGSNDVWIGLALLVVANTCFGTGEDLIAAFLPEIATRDTMGRISAFGWTVGYVGGLFSLGVCLLYINWARGQGLSDHVYVPVAMLLTSGMFFLGSLPTFLFLKERAKPDPELAKVNHVKLAFERLGETIKHASHYKDLARFLLTLFCYSCGTTTVFTLASVYAQQVMGFSTADSIIMILVVNVTGAIGAFSFGFIQDKFGSIRTLAVSLVIWACATSLAFAATTRPVFWVVAILVGIAMGASQSAGRALVGLFSPEGRSAEFFGLWGLVVKLATAVGPLSFGLVSYLTNSNYRIAILSTTIFFVVAVILLFTVDEKRGRLAAHVLKEEAMES